MQIKVGTTAALKHTEILRTIGPIRTFGLSRSRLQAYCSLVLSLGPVQKAYFRNFVQAVSTYISAVAATIRSSSKLELRGNYIGHDTWCISPIILKFLVLYYF